MSGDEDRDTKYQVMFSGKKKDFAQWVTKYEATAMRRKFGDILDGTKVLRRKIGPVPLLPLRPARCCRSFCRCQNLLLIWVSFALD